MARIAFEGLRKRYGDVEAVRGLDVTFDDGALVGLLGPSGCGKTTTLRMLAGLERPTAGRILLGDRVVDDAARGLHVPPEARNLGMVFQSYAVWPHKSVLENVAYPLRLRGVDRAATAARAREALQTVELAALASRMPHALSGGQQQRVALARALVHSPDVLLLDEPLSNLDARLRDEMRGELSRLARGTGATVVYVTHDQREALALCDVVVVMKDGLVEQVAAPEDLYARPRTAFVGAFVGAMSFLDGKLLPDGVDVGGARVALVDVAVAPGVEPGPVRVGVRPEWIELDEGAGRGSAALEGRVEQSLFLGAHHEVRAATALGPLLLRVASTRARPRPGDVLPLRVLRAAAFPAGA